MICSCHLLIRQLIALFWSAAARLLWLQQRRPHLFVAASDNACVRAWRGLCLGSVGGVESQSGGWPDIFVAICALPPSAPAVRPCRWTRWWEPAASRTTCRCRGRGLPHARTSNSGSLLHRRSSARATAGRGRGGRRGVEVCGAAQEMRRVPARVRRHFGVSLSPRPVSGPAPADVDVVGVMMDG